MIVRPNRAGWRSWALTGCAAVTVAVSAWVTPILLSQERTLQTAPAPEVTFESWFQGMDPAEDYGPISICFDEDSPPSQDFIEKLMNAAFDAGRLPESYHLIHPDGVAMNNHHTFWETLADGTRVQRHTFNWWENVSAGGPQDGSNPRYFIGSRWSGSQGSPRALTWSFVPDGLNIPGSGGEAASANSIFARMDSQFAAQGGRATWINRFTQCFTRWQQVSSLTFTRVTAAGVDWDDGGAFPGSAGGATRGDIRICAHNIDGVNGTLAYTFFPSTGDMVMDSSESWGTSSSLNRFLRNTVMHELGHAWGIDHVCSNNAAFLMEPFLSTTFDGPMHDDMRAVQRHYGDLQEADDTTATGTNLGTIANGATNNTACTIPAPISGSNPANSSNCSIDANGEQDFFRFTINSSALCTVVVTPVGFSYDDNAQAANGSCPSGSTTNTLTRANLAVELRDTNGTTVLATASGNAAGVAETLSNIPLASAGQYYVRVFESDAPTQTQMYTLSVSITAGGCVAPAITLHPTGDTICAGDTFSFSVTASGTAPLSYQWQKNTVNIGGATNPTYDIPVVAISDAGSYRCVVTNACGNATSNAAVLGVNDRPTVNTHPVSQSVAVGQTVNFTVAATGSGTLFYQWTRNSIALSDGGSISGATTDSLTITNVQVANAGDYRCDVSNVCGGVSSNVATLTVGGCAAPVITDQPDPLTVCSGAPAAFTVSATGTGTITYQWRKNTVDIGGATSATYSIGTTVVGDSGSYDCVVTDDCSSTTSNSAALTVNAAPAIGAHPSPQTVSVGQTANFSVSATGAGSLSYQWRKGATPLSDGGNISGATSASLTITNCQLGDAGNYACDVTNACGTTASNAAALTVNPPCPGDIDGNNAVDIGDLSTLLSNFGIAFGATFEQGDLDGDGDVDLGDLTALLALFGTTC